MGTLVEVSNDSHGILWPAAVAPFAVHLVALDLADPAVAEHARKAYTAALDAGIEILFDDRPDVSPGAKFAEADLIGIPVRWVVSRKTGVSIEVKGRSESKAELTTFKKAFAEVV